MNELPVSNPVTPVEIKTGQNPLEANPNPIAGQERGKSQPTEKERETSNNLRKGLENGINPENLIKGFVEGVYDRVDEESVKQEQTNHKKENLIEKQFEEAVQEYMKTQGLEYPNLESDARFDEIRREIINKFPENKIDEEARKIFKQRFKYDYYKYTIKGIYRSLEEDPRYKDILANQKRRFTNIAEQSKDNQKIRMAEIEAKRTFLREYPEIAEIYAIKDEDLKSYVKDEKGNKKDENQTNTPESPQNKDEQNDKKPDNKETDQMKKKLEEISKELESLRKEISNLRGKLGELEKLASGLTELEEYAGELIKKLGLEGAVNNQNNQQTEQKTDNSQETQKAEGQGQESTRFSNLKKLLEILMAIAGAGGLITISAASKS